MKLIHDAFLLQTIFDSSVLPLQPDITLHRRL